MDDVNKVVELDLSGKKFISENLARFINLQKLNASNTQFNRVDILDKIPALRWADLTNTPTKDLSLLRPKIINGSLTIVGKDDEIRKLYGIKSKGLDIDTSRSIAIPKSPYKLRVLILGLPLSILCGVTSVQKDLARVLLLAGHEVLMVNYFPIVSKDINLVLVKMEGNNLKSKAIIANRDIEVILRAIKKLKFYPHIVDAHTHTLQSNAMLDKLLSELDYPPLCFTIHDILPYRQLLTEHEPSELLSGEVDPAVIKKAIDLSYYTSKRSPAQKEMIEKADAIINISENHKKAMSRLFGKNVSEKCFVIKNTTPFWFIINSPEVINNARKIRNVIDKEGGFVLFYSGRISAEKMIETLMFGFNKICEELPNTKLLLIGAKKDLKRSLVESYGLDERFISNVIPTGWIKDLKEYAAYYLAGDILVQPGKTQNLYSISAIEAMVAKKPVVSVPGELSSGIAATPQNLYKNVIRIIKNYDFYRKYCNEIYAKALGYYGPVKFLNKHLGMYNFLLKRKPKFLRLLKRAGKKQLKALGFIYDVSMYGFRIRIDKLKTKNIGFPEIEGIDERKCCEYARLAAQKLFGLGYMKADAWNISKMPGNYVVWKKYESKEDYHKLIQPGDLVGIYIRTSPSNRPNRSYTHLALYLGEGRILHQLVKNIFISDLDKLMSKENLFVLKEVIRTNRKVKSA